VLPFLLLFILGQSATLTTLADAPVPDSLSAQKQSERWSSENAGSLIEDDNTTAVTSTLLFDDFSGDISKWSDPIGTWNIEEGELVGQAGYDGGWIYAGDTSWTNYEFQAKLFFYSNAQLVFRSTGHLQNEYHLDLKQLDQVMGNTYAIYKYQEGILTDLSGGDIYSPVPLANPCVVKVQVTGNYLILYINDHYITEIFDPDPLPNGRIGLGMNYDFWVRFDDVLVTTLPPLMLLPTEQEKVGHPTDAITYTINLENHTGITDSFDLEALPGYQWMTTLSTDRVGPIADGARVSFNAQVDIPPEALPGDFDSATIQATSVTSPTVYTQTAIINTNAISRKIGYVTMPVEGRLALIDTEIHSSIGFIDLGVYGCDIPSKVRLSPDKSQLYINCGSPRVIIIETVNNSFVASVDLPSAGNDIVFTPDGSFAFVSSPIGQVFVIDTDSHEIVKTIPTVGVVSIASHPYLPRIYLGGNDSHNASKIQIIDTNSFTVTTTIPFQYEIYGIQPSPDGRWIYVTAMNFYPAQPSIYKLDSQTLATSNKLWDHGYLSAMQVTPDNTKLFVAEAGFGRIHVIDPNSFTYITSITVGNVIHGMGLTSNSGELYVGTESNYSRFIPVIDTHDYTITYQITIPGSWSDGVAITPQVSDVYTGKAVNTTIASPGETVRYGITFNNFSPSVINNVVITDTLPTSLTYKIGSLSATSGIYGYKDGVITWTGSVTASDSIDIKFWATVSPSTMIGKMISNTAIISAPTETFTRTVAIDIVQEQLFLPCAFKNCPPSFKDDFSDLGSGWPIETDSDYSMGYQNGEYFITANPGWIVWSLQDFGASDFQMEVDTHPATRTDGSVGIIFGATDDGFYLFEISDYMFSLFRIDYSTWTWTPLIDGTYSPAINPGYQTNRLKVIRMGANITVYANGQVLGTASDGTYTGTWLGMAIESGYFVLDERFDNFILYTGTCIGVYETSSNVNHESSFDATWTKPGTGPGRP
jgi:uncharacterized repeat protein (TIGR01451 family)